MKKILTLTCLCIALWGHAQRKPQIIFAVTNSNSAYPFSRFGGLFKPPLHPGLEMGYTYNWKTKPKHDWFQEIKLGYFFHRFVQHGILLYTNLGYRYKFSSHLSADATLGAGYMQSIPATAKFSLNDNGEYKSSAGIGRMQAVIVTGISPSWSFHLPQNRNAVVFAAYQQRIQTPFVKSYVPLLPYNTIIIGMKLSLNKKHSS